MSLDKLFGVLVVGGSLLAVAGCSSDEGRDQGRGPLLNEPDAAPPGAPDAAPPGAPDAATPAGELLPCFCDSDLKCCKRDESGRGTLQPGFECCWGTC